MVILHVTQTFANSEERTNYVNDLYAAGVPQTSRSEDGNIMYDYFFSRDRDNEMILIEKWESEEALAAHQSTDLFKTIPSIKAPYEITTSVERFNI